MLISIILWDEVRALKQATPTPDNYNKSSCGLNSNELTHHKYHLIKNTQIKTQKKYDFKEIN